MPIISRLFSYNPGESARGDHVQQEFDQLVSTVNLLETDKLGTVGGTVSNLTVSGTFTAQGISNFNAGITVNGNPGTFTAGITVSGGDVDITSGDLKLTSSNNIKLDGNLDFIVAGNITNCANISGSAGDAVNFLGVAPTATSAPVLGNDLTRKDYVDAGVDGRIARTSVSGTYEILDGVTIGVGTNGTGNGIEIHNDAGEPLAAAQRGLLSNATSYSLLGLGLEEFLMFTDDFTAPIGITTNVTTAFGLNHLSMRGGNNQNDKFTMTRDQLNYADGTAGNELTIDSRELEIKRDSGTTVHSLSAASGLSLTGFSQAFTVDVVSAKLDWNIQGLPTSPGGLSTGDIYSNGGVLTIV